MDWAKAKTILIVAFIIANLVLSASIYKNYNQDKSSLYFTNEYQNYLVNLYKKKNIKLPKKLPKDCPMLGTISVEYEAQKEEVLNELLFEYGGYLNVSDDDKKISFTGNHKLASWTKSSADKFIEEFFKKYPNSGEKKLRFFKKTKDVMIIEYAASVEGKYFLEDSYLKFEFKRNSKFTFKKLWLKPIEYSPQKKRVITSTQALFKLYKQINDNEKIKKIELIYRVNLKWDSSIRTTQMAKAFPVWKVTLENKKEKYIQAYDF